MLPALRLLLTGLVLVLIAPAAWAGSICGQITDAASGQPVAGAGVFVRDPAGAYVGAAAVSDAGGAYCVPDLPAGIYTLEIRVDDYLVRYVNGVEVADTVSDVPVSLGRPDARLAPPWPNPAAATVKLRLEVARPVAVELGIYDLRGRLLRRWTAAEVPAGDRDYAWDGRDAAGRPAPAGLYLVRLRAGDSASVRPVVLTR